MTIAPRRIVYWASVGTTAAGGVMNLIAIGLDLHHGTSIVAPTLGTLACVGALYLTVAAETWMTTQDAIRAAQQRNLSALADIQDHALAQMRAGTISVTVAHEDGSRTH